jgi:hypothetical protein
VNWRVGVGSVGGVGAYGARPACGCASAPACASMLALEQEQEREQVILWSGEETEAACDMLVRMQREAGPAERVLSRKLRRCRFQCRSGRGLGGERERRAGIASGLGAPVRPQSEHGPFLGGFCLDLESSLARPWRQDQLNRVTKAVQ